MEIIILIFAVASLAWFVFMAVHIKKIAKSTDVLCELAKNGGWYAGQKVCHRETNEQWFVKSINGEKVECYNRTNTSKIFLKSELEK